jgi:hypothetical protein
MRFLKRVSIVVTLILAVVLAACSDGIFSSHVFQSPLAFKTMESPLSTAALAVMTMKPMPTQAVTAAPASTFPTSIPTVSSPCIQLAQLDANLGNNICIAVKILATGNWGSDFVMWLDQNPATRYIVVHNTFYLGVEGACLQITGVVQRDAEGRLFIRADEPGQVNPCPR